MAVIGVSLSNDRHPANVIYYKNHLRYPVNVYPVNPQGGDLQGEKVYARLGDIPEKVDLAVIGVRAEQVPGVLEECVAAGAGGAAVISGGFAENGRKDLQDRLVAIARETDFPFVGPNCLGLYSPKYVDTFSSPMSGSFGQIRAEWPWSAKAAGSWSIKWSSSRWKAWACL